MVSNLKLYIVSEKFLVPLRPFLGMPTDFIIISHRKNPQNLTIFNSEVDAILKLSYQRSFDSLFKCSQPRGGVVACLQRIDFHTFVIRSNDMSCFKSAKVSFLIERKCVTRCLHQKKVSR